LHALKLFTRYAREQTFIAITTGALAGLFYALLIPVEMKAICGAQSALLTKANVVVVLGLKVAHAQLAFIFACLCCLTIGLRAIPQLKLYQIALTIRFEPRKQLYRRVRESSVSALEEVGRARLIQALANDVAAIVLGAQLLPELILAAVLIIGLLGYLAYLNAHAFLYVLEAIALSAIVYQVPIRFAFRLFNKLREFEEQLQEGFKGLVDGAKELKLSVEKREIYERDALSSVENQFRILEKRAWTIFCSTNNVGSLMCFFTIGGLTFVVVNYHNLGRDDLVACIMVLLYLTGPITVLLNFTPQFAKTRIALQKINKLYDDLPKEDAETDWHPCGLWKTIHLRRVTYKYGHSKAGAEGFEGKRVAKAH
jgi:putative ATP-binding cassette transporter